jgi:ketosteroid isomerase-like protein
MVPLDHGTFRAWLDEYATAWETADADAAAALFAADATYHVTPFAEPLAGRDAIRDYWAETTATQDEASVDTTVEGLGRDHGVARFHASFRRDGDPIVVDGCLRARLLGGDCVEFREWWHTTEQS